MPTINLEKLVKRYGDVLVVHGIEVEMADNEVTVLVGVTLPSCFRCLRFIPT